MKVVALVPAKDRADSIAATVTATRALRHVDSVLVVDDASEDSTADAARGAGAAVLRLGRNRGKGGALRAGVEASPSADVFLLVDADLGGTAASLQPLLDAVVADEADLAIGVLPPAAGRGGFGLIKKFARWGIGRGSGFFHREPLSGQRAIRANLLRATELAGRFGVEVAMTIDAVRAGARIVELPVEVEHRHTGRSLAGFRHRAGQGRDIARALWPRLVGRGQRVALMVLVGLLLLGAMAFSGSRWQPSSVPVAGDRSKVVLFGFTHLSFDDVSPTGDAPFLRRLMQRGMVGALNVRTSSGSPSTYEAYTTLGAGDRVKGSSRVADAIARPSGDASIVVRGAQDAARVARGRHASGAPGALGDALAAAHRTTGAVGNADFANGGAAMTPNRAVAASVMTHTGSVGTGDIGPSTLESAPSYPSGVRASTAGISAAVGQALRAADVVAVDPGDMERAVRARQPSPGDRAEAVRHTDAVLEAVVRTLPSRTLLVVLSPVPVGARWRVTPLVVVGARSTAGYVESTSTKRDGYATLADIAPTVLEALGEPVDAAMVGAPLRYRTAPVDLEHFRRLDGESRLREEIYLPVTVAYVIAAIVLYIAALVVLSRRAVAISTRRRVAFVVLAAAAFPLATFAYRALPGAFRLGTGGAWLIAPLSFGLAALAARAGRYALAPLGWIFAATTVVIIGDVATGSRLHTSSILGYALQSSGRYYGLPNTSFAVVAACVLLGSALHVAFAPRRDEALLWTGIVTFVVVVGIGGPTLGADVGGLVTLTPIAVIALWKMWGRRIWPVGLVAAAVGLVAALSAAALFDSDDPESRTHLGKFVSAVQDNHASAIDTIARKLDTNLGLLTQAVWSWLVPVAALLLMYLVLRDRRLASILPVGTPLRVGAVAAVVASLVAFVANDSGPVVIALFLTMIAPFLMSLALTREPPPVLLAAVDTP